MGYIFGGAILFLILLILCFYWYNKDGILFFADFNRVGVIIWSIGLSFYDLSLSSLYKPNVIINAVAVLVILNFLFLSFRYKNNIKQVYYIFDNIQINNACFLVLFLIFLLGLFSFIVNLKFGYLRFFSSNKGGSHYIKYSYFLNMLIPVSMIFYFIARTEKKIKNKIIFFAFSFFSLFMIFCNLSRGPILYWIIGVTIYEIAHFFKNSKTKKITKKQVLILLILLVITIWGFGFIGEIRTSGYGWISTNDHYKMIMNFPKGFTWVYIYLSSPLENLREILTNQIPNYLQLGNNLFYPFVKGIANIFGRGQEYIKFLDNTSSVYPYLASTYGLNVSSFVADAIQDFGYFGIFIYLFFYDIISVLYSKMLSTERISDIAKAVIIPIIIQITLWSIFDDSVFRIIIIWIDIFVILIWDYFSKLDLIKFCKGLNNEKK